MMKNKHTVVLIALACFVCAGVAMQFIMEPSSTSALPRDVRAALPANATIIEDTHSAVTMVTDDAGITDVRFYNAKGEPITQFIDRDGKVDNLDNLVWLGQYQLAKTPPVNVLATPLVMMRSQEMLPMGMGELGTTSLYWIREDAVEEVLRVVTKREWIASAEEENAESEDSPESISMTATITCDWNVPSCEYRYYSADEDIGTAQLEWNAQKNRFLDPTGFYNDHESDLKL